MGVMKATTTSGGSNILSSAEVVAQPKKPEVEDSATDAVSSSILGEATLGSNGAQLAANLTVPVILGLIGVVCFSARLFSILRFESVIHEYDPYFNYRTTRFLNDEGYEEFWNWFDESSWYPLGRVIGQTLFPGIMTSAYLLSKFTSFVGIPLEIRDVCVFTAPIFSALCAWAGYLLTFEATGIVNAGLFSALFIGVSPSYMSRSVGGAFDNEAIAIFTLVFSFYTFLRAMRKASVASILVACFAYFYMVTAWGGYVFVTNTIAIYVLMLMFLKRFTERHFYVYSLWYIIGTTLCLNIPFVGYAAVTSSEHMVSHGVLFLSVLYVSRVFLSNYVSRASLARFVKYSVGIGFIAFACAFVLLLAIGKTRWSGRSMTLLDPTYASKHIPIIASVSEHQPTTWGSYIFDLHAPYLFAPVGVWVTLKSKNIAAWFLALFGILAAYFSGVMVRLMLVLSPAVGALGAVGASVVLSQAKKLLSQTTESTEETSKKQNQKTSRSFRLNNVSLLVCLVAVLFVSYFACQFVLHSTWAAAFAYSHPSIVIMLGGRDTMRIIQDDFREGYSWLRLNTHPKSRIMSWWDYGYQSCFMGNRTVMVDNNTWNNSHIATIGMAFSLPEEVSHPVVSKLDVDYVFVIFGGASRYSGDDINKFLWMVRIGGGVFPYVPREPEYYTATHTYAVGRDASDAMKNSLMYRMSYYRFHDNAITRGYDVLRRTQIPEVAPLKYFEEVFTSSSWIVRIYRVKKQANRLAYGQRELRNVLDEPSDEVDL